MTTISLNSPSSSLVSSAAARLPSVSVVVPAYRSERTLPELVRRLAPVLASCANDFELVLVNDGSPDGTERVIGQLADRYSWIRGIHLMRNYGQHNALLCGVRAARFDIIVTIDDDLQHPPEEIPRLLAQLATGYDVVYGTPQVLRHGFFRDRASVIIKLAMHSALGAQTARHVSAFRVFRRTLCGAFVDFRGSLVSLDVLLTYGTVRFGSLPVRHEPRTIGASTYTFRKLLVHALNMITGFSTLPLRLASLVGFAFTIFGVGVLSYVVGVSLWAGSSVPGFPFLASIIALFSGTQLFALGIIGEYLGRMYAQTMQCPPYVVRHDVPPRDADAVLMGQTDSSTTAD